MSLSLKINFYLFKISIGLVGVKARKLLIKKLKREIVVLLKKRPDLTFDEIVAEYGKPKEIIKESRKHDTSIFINFLSSIKKLALWEWIILVMGFLMVLWLIYAAFGGTIG